MSVRKNTNPRALNLSPELQEILQRNGMKAQIAQTQDGSFRLVVQGHDSPVMSYAITTKQLNALTDWGTNTANRKAYNTFASLVKDNFYLPKDFTHARNANGRMAMGLHGYRVGAGEYGRPATAGWRVHGPGGYCHPFLGWSPRQQEGWHLRRIGGELYYGGAPMVADRPDGRMKPGELQSGGYGFYYKGDTQTISGSQQGIDPLSELQTAIQPITYTQRPEKEATPYSQAIASDVYFTTEKWQQVLAEHGLVVDATNKTLIVQSQNVPVDLAYDLTDEQLAVILNPDLKESSVEQRLSTINQVLSVDFSQGVTKADLESTKIIDLPLKPEVAEELNTQLTAQEQQYQALEQQVIEVEQAQRPHLPEDKREGVINMDGHDLDILDPNKGWYREGNHGREVTVDDIRVEPSPETEGKYKMTAIIDGKTVSHEISKKDYEKFSAIDDMHRFKMFSKIFKEVDLKTRPADERVQVQRGGDGRDNAARVFGAIFAGLAVTGEVIGLVKGGPGHGRPSPEFYGGGSVYHKPGVDSPADIAHRAFEAGMNTADMQHDLGRGR